MTLNIHSKRSNNLECTEQSSKSLHLPIIRP